ncbi:MAG: hypothetical protein J6U23_00180 [Clostridiales bacterium]|nr:hypothetical protein [Clostridiales bacterium]
MRFDEDLKYYYFSENSRTDDEERSIIYEHSKNIIRGYIKRTFGPEKSLGANIKKFAPVVIFFVVVILLIIFSLNKMVGPILYTFGGIFVVAGILLALPGNQIDDEKPSTSKIPRGLGSAMAILVGLAVIIPTILAPKYGYAKCMVAGGASCFAAAGLFFIIYTIIGMARFSRAQSNPVQGRCIGYIKMLEGSENDAGPGRLFVVGTPVFEYTKNGTTYRAFQENNMRTGRLTPEVGETVILGTLPEDPYAVFYHKNTKAKIFAFVMSAIAIAVGIFLFIMIPKVTDSNGFRVNTMGGDVQIAKAQFNDKDIEKKIGTSDYTIEYLTVKSVYEEDGTWYVEFTNGRKSKLGAGVEKEYSDGMSVYMIIPDDRTKGIITFLAEDYEYAGSKPVEGLPE